MDQYDDLDPEGSCMAQIQALVQSEYSDGLQSHEKEPRRAGRAVNHDSCDSCGEGGDLLCCDRCPCAFHFTCCDPPLDEDDIPSGEWLCNKCRNTPLEEQSEADESEELMLTEDEIPPDTSMTVNNHDEASHDTASPFSTLVKMSSRKNPSTFTLPPELTCNTYFPGDRKQKLDENSKSSKRDFDEGSHLDKLCFACTKSSLHGELIECDFCPLSFHTNCMNPPLTNKPTGMWMCPNHAEHAEPGLKDPRFSRRLKAYNELRNNVSQHAIKVDFLDRVHRLRSHPDFERKQGTWKRRRQTMVPAAIKDHYKNPPIQQIPAHIRECLKPLPPYRLPVAPPTSEEQEEWLKAVVSLQCNIAKHISSLSNPKQDHGLKKPVKTSPSSFNHVLPTSKTTTTTNSTTTKLCKGTSATSLVTTAAPTILTSAVRTIPLSKPSTSMNATTKLVTSPISNSSTSVTGLNRVVTTHTITSGGKTLTKPITILYASPSKSQQNGVGSSLTKHLTFNNCITKMPGESAVAKAGFKLDTSAKTTATLHSSLTNSSKGNVLNELKALANGPLQNMKTKGEVTKAANVSTNGTTASSSSNLKTATKAIPSTSPGSTKVIVLTNSANSSIIKNIASTTLSTSIQRPLVNSALSAGNSGVISSTTTSPNVQRIVVSPQKVVVNSSGGGGGTGSSQVASPSAVNAICAVSGLDTLQESELSKLDPRLVHVLAYQRLQQLVAQTTGKATTSNVPRKISFNGTKETVVLPQNVPRGKAMAVLCPINGEGSSCPMIYKALNIGQAPDMDVCLRNYGYCNYLSDKHCSVFYDEATKQYELLNYSEHGTYVDNVLYSCDFSDKPNRTTVTSARRLDPTKFDPVRVCRDKISGDRKKGAAGGKESRRTSGLGIQVVTRPCSCMASSSSMIGGSGAGWEGTATLHHGSYIKVGCLQFIFSVVSHARKVVETPKRTTKDKVPTTSE